MYRRSNSLPEFANDPHGLLFMGTFDSADGSKLFGEAKCGETSVNLSGKTHSGGLQGCVKVESINPDLLLDLRFPSFDTIGKGYISQFFFDLTFASSSRTWSGSVKGTDVSIVPMTASEPAGLALLGAGLLGLGTLARRKLLAK